jgi:hypothetical protein
MLVKIKYIRDEVWNEKKPKKNQWTVKKSISWIEMNERRKKISRSEKVKWTKNRKKANS